MSSVRVAAAIGTGLALADGSIVVLALPAIQAEFDASVEAVAAVIGAYTLALGLGLLAVNRWSGRPGAARLGPAGMLGFAVASAAAGVAPTMGLLIGLRAVHGLQAALVLGAAFELLAGGHDRGRLWRAAAIFGAAAGPALGGALTELLDWRAIFLIQAPVAIVAALVLQVGARPTSEPSRNSGRTRLSIRAVCLGLLSAALTGVLFLLVLLLVSGWALSPLEAAAVVSVLPIAAFLGARVPGDPASRAIVGSALVGAGVLSLAFLPLDTVAMTIAPQLVAGVGMGMALPAMAGGLLPERSSTDAAKLLAVRHLGITAALAILAPVAAVELEGAAEQVRERGAALILDARLPPENKLGLAAVATSDLDAIAPRATLSDSLDQARHAIDRAHVDEYDRVQDRADETLVVAVNGAFAPTFLFCGALALLAAGGLLISARPGAGRAAIAACVLAAALVPAQAAIAVAERPEPVAIADPCEGRSLPGTGGLSGLLQDGALVLLDQAACSLGSSREELALALVDEHDARAYEDEYGVNPRSAGDLLSTILNDESSPLGRLLDDVLGL
jgi:predicted MFS family arabinose efflux permease